MDGDYCGSDGSPFAGPPSIENAFKDFFAENKGLSCAST